MDFSVRSWEGSDEHDDSDQGGHDEDDHDFEKNEDDVDDHDLIVLPNSFRKRGMFVVNPIFFAGFLLSGGFSASFRV